MPSTLESAPPAPLLTERSVSPLTGRIVLVRAWADALARRAYRFVLSGGRRARPRVRGLYDTAPVKLTADESRRVEEILKRRSAA
jgi:hypothetical protein